MRACCPIHRTRKAFSACVRMPKRRADGLPVSAESDTRPCRHVLVMEILQDPSNMGNVLRTADAAQGVQAFGACGCLLRASYAPKVLRGSMGAVFRLGIRRSETAEDCLKVLRAREYHVTRRRAGQQRYAHHDHSV